MRSDVAPGALRDIAHHIELAVHFTAGLDYETFRDDLRTVYAVTRCLEIRGRLHPVIPWKEIAGAGNVYRYDYEDVAASYVWRTVQNSLPPLRAAIQQELIALDTPQDSQQ